MLELRNRISAFRRLPWLLLGRSRVASEIATQYAQTYRTMVNAISCVSGKSVIVDSSKYPTDLSVIRKHAGLPLYTIHLVRNCNAVVYSWKRKKLRTEIHWENQLMPRYGALQTSLGWKLFNRAISRVTSDDPHHYKRVRYEDLTTQFESVMSQLFGWLGVGSVDLTSESSLFSHSVSGNPCRFQNDALNLREDNEWIENIGLVDRLIVRAVCGRDQTELGYQ